MRDNYVKSKLYDDVHEFRNNGQWKARFRLLGKTVVTFHESEREAGKWIDIQRIKQGMEPINVLKRL